MLQQHIQNTTNATGNSVVYISQFCASNSIQKNIHALKQEASSAHAQHALLCIFPQFSLTGHLQCPPYDAASHNAHLASAIKDFAQHTKAHDTAYLLPLPKNVAPPLAPSLATSVLLQKDNPPKPSIPENEHHNRYAPIIIYKGKAFQPTQHEDTLYVQQPLPFSTAAISPLSMQEACQKVHTIMAQTPQTSKSPDIIAISAAFPYHHGQNAIMQQAIASASKAYKVTIALCNPMGANQGTVFIGGSSIATAEGQALASQAFSPKPLIATVPMQQQAAQPQHQAKQSTANYTPLHLSQEEARLAYNAMLLGLRQYYESGGFSGVIIGVSGGADSALVATIAADAIGPQNTFPVFMPSKFTSKNSYLLAQQLCKNLSLTPNAKTINIQKLCDEALLTLEEGQAPQKNTPLSKAPGFSVMKENIQARVRGLLLMSYANAGNMLLLATGNKSEAATGFCTIYGDTCGGFNPIQDIYKTQLYTISNWRNHHTPELSSSATAGTTPKEAIIPAEILSREPSAELAPNQKDSDRIPPYNTLDTILHLHIEQALSQEEIIPQGFEANTVIKILSMLEGSAWKRRQSPVGVRLSVKGL